MKTNQLPRSNMKFPPKPKDFVNGLFAPVTHDIRIGQPVVQVTLSADDTVTMALTSGAAFFAFGLSSYDLVLQEVDQWELPPGHHGRVFYWDRILAQRVDGGSPLTALAGQQVTVDVGLEIPNHALPPGPVSGAVSFQGASLTGSVALSGTYLAVDEATPIGQKWLALGGESFFGPVLSNTTADPDGGGTRQQFANGMLYDTPGRGAFFVGPSIEQKWLSATATGDYVRTSVGMPVGDTFSTAEGGQAQRFEFGVAVIRADRRGFAVYGAIYADCAQFGDLSSAGNQPFLGLPNSDEQVNAFGRFQGFDGADIYWTPALGAHEVHGEIRRHWYALGGAAGFLGLPITDELGMPDGVGRLNRFQGGLICWTPDTGAHEVHGMILERWNALGTEQSYLGYPVSDEMGWVNPANSLPGRISAFQYGQIGWTAQGGAVELPESKSFHDVVVTPAGTALGGWVDMTLWSNGGYKVHFHMHDSSRIADYDYVVRAIFTGSNGLTLVAQHSGHSSFDDGRDDYEESGFNDFIRKGWPAVRDGRFAVTKDYSATGLVGFLEDLGKFVLDLTAGAVGGAVGMVIALTSEVGQVFGNLGLGGTFGVLAGIVVFAVGGTLILALAAGVAVGAMTNALIQQRRIRDDEWNFAAAAVFGTALPPADRIMLTNLSGIGGRPFTMPGIDQQIYINLGHAFDNPLGYKDDTTYPAAGQLLIHELTHAWQIAHSRFLPGLFCQGFVNQTNNTVVEDVYRYGPPGPDWSAFNLEQQAAIVDQWFGGNAVAAVPNRQPHDTRDPYFRYIAGNVQAGLT